MRSGSPKPVQAATASIGSAPLSTCSRAASSRSRSISLAGVVPVSAATRLMPNLFLRVHVLRRVRRGGAVQCLPELRRVCAASDPAGRRAATGSLHWKTTGGGKRVHLKWSREEIAEFARRVRDIHSENR